MSFLARERLIDAMAMIEDAQSVELPDDVSEACADVYARLESVTIRLSRSSQADTPGKLALIRHQVALRFNKTDADLKGENRCDDVVTARHSYFWLARRLTGYSFARIGRSCGHRDHTTVLSGTKRVADKVLSDLDFAKLLLDLERDLKSAINRGGLDG